MEGIKMTRRSLLFNLILALAVGSVLFLYPSVVESQSPITLLSHRVIDAEYSRQLDRIVSISATPLNQLHVIDPLTGASVDVDLSLPPTCVSVGPDGLFAAVGHNEWISYVNLSTPALVKILPVTADVVDIVLAGNGWTYAFPRLGQFQPIRCVNLESGAEFSSTGLSIYAGTRAKLHPNGDAMYGANNGLSPSFIEKYGITQGPAAYLYYNGDYPMCGNLWISKDGLRIFTKCGNVFSSSEIRTEDMLYNGSLESISSIADLSHSASADKVLAIPGNLYGHPPDWDTEVWKYDYTFLNFESKMTLPDFSINGQPYASHGRFVFFSADGTRYFVVVQADESSGMLLDYGIYAVGPDNEQFVIEATAGLGGMITPSGEVQVVEGASATFSIIPDPGYEVADVMVDGVSVGNVISYTFENTTASHTIEVLFTPFPKSEIALLNHRVIDAEYSKQLDRIVTISAAPRNQLHVVDPLTGATAVVYLSLPPTCVSVGPDGLFAAVGHDGWVSYVNLVTPALVKTIPVSTDVLDIVLTGNGWAYAFPRQDQWETIRSVNLESGVEFLSTHSIYAGTLAKLHPSGNAIYGADNGLSPSDIEKYDITQGAAVYLYDSPYHGDYKMCGNLWVSEDGFRIFTKCGNVFRSSPNRTEDMTYNGSLGGIGSIIDLSQSVSADKVLAIPTSPDTEVWKYDYSILNFRSRIRFPTFPVNGHGYASHGKFVFFSADGSRYFVIVQADASSGTAFDYGIFTLGTDVEQFIITATAATGGTITPWSEVPVYEGNNQSFIIAPSTGYHTSDVMVDGVSVGVVTRYEFTNVTSNHTITAIFAKNPDLIVSTLTGPIDVAPGQVISLSEATRNQGTGATTVNTVTRFYWSTDTNYDASDVILGQRTVGPLTAGETSGPVDTSVTIPPTAVTGTYYIMAWADADKSVAEIANNNNRKYIKVRIIRPDLIVSTLTGPIDVAPGQVISLSEATKNQGTGATTVNTVTRFYWSTDTNYDASDVPLGERTVGPLAAGETSGPVDTSVTIPPTAVAGTYYIMAWADADKSVAEIANNNNRRYKRVTVPP